MKRNVLPKLQGPCGSADLCSLSPQRDTSLHYETMYKWLGHCVVCLFMPELLLVLTESAWVAGLHTKTVHLQTITHHSTHPPQRRVTSLMQPIMLLLDLAANPQYYFIYSTVHKDKKKPKIL